MRAFCLNNISKVAINALKTPDEIVENVEDADSILVRSFAMQDYQLPRNILAIARAGAGVNNIPFDEYAKKGVVVFNTPGANANAVKELVIAAALLASRDIVGGINWVSENKDDENIAKTVEKAKSKFAGKEIMGKTIAVIGLGVIGVLVADAFCDLGMKVKGYDPFLSINNAMKLNRQVKYFERLEDTIAGADFVTIHVPSMDSTRGMIDKNVFDNLADEAVVLNFSRDTLINEDALKEALEYGKIKKYVTDFANANVVTFPNTIILPHLGASTEEAEDNCAMMAINELKDYLESGNVTNSVNYPSLNAGPKHSIARICICHSNVPGMINKFTKLISDLKANIVALYNQSKTEYAYTILDINQMIDVTPLNEIEGVIRVRVL